MDKVWELARKILVRAEPGIGDHTEGVEALRRLWEENKQWMFPYLDENYRMNVEVSPELRKEDLEAALKESYRIACQLSRKEKYLSVILQDHGEAAVRLLRHLMTSHFTEEEILENKLIDRKDDPSRKGKMLPEGTKVSKYIVSHIMNNDDLFARDGILFSYGKSNASVVADFAIDLYSQIISILKRKDDTVVISANPVDIILASNHTHGWRSCHRIFGGEHRTGQLSYLCDKVSLIAFAYRVIDEVDCMKEEWPRKLWRQMVFVDKYRLGAFFSREYPNMNATYARAVRGLTAMLLSKYGNTEYKWKYKSVTDDCLSDPDDDNSNGENHMLLGPGTWHYRDNPTAAIRMLPDGKYPIVYPGITVLPCCRCGEGREDEEDSDSLVCSDCDPTLYCSCCGKEIENEDGMTIDSNGVRYCRYCWEENFYECILCGETIHRNDAIHVKEFDNYVCPTCCAKYYLTCDYCGELYENITMTILANGQHYCERCLDSHAFRCDVCGDFLPNTCQKFTTSDGYNYCQVCVHRVYSCIECNAVFRYNYGLINGRCEKCATSHANNKQGVMMIEV
jgi:hypothetical protein